MIKHFFMKQFFFIVFLFSSFQSWSQNLSAYNDYRNYFQAFDNGEFRQLEYMPVKSFKTGGHGIAYIDNTNEFRIYADQQKFDITYGGTLSYFTTDYLIAYRVGKVLSVFENQHAQNLSYYCSIYAINDSLLGFFDESNYNFSVFYQGNVIALESSMLEPPKSMKTGSNTLAFINQSNFFRVFYHGIIYPLDNIAPLAYQAGSDLVAYVDDYDQNFHLFYKGDTASIETFAPDSFKVGFGTMAYVDNLGNFRVFYEGATRRLLSYRPDFFQLKGYTVLYAFNNNFNVFYKGEVHTLEDYIPADFQMANEGVAYIDVSGRLKLFLSGKTYTISYEIINKYELNGNVLTYSVGTNTTKFFWNGKNY
jgi:hypothetical protein